jgi:CDP-paratose 2-epimerase
MGAEKPKVINVSGGIESAMSLAQLSAWCAENAGSHEVLRDGGDRAFDLPWVVLDRSLAEKTWNWQPRIPLETILSEILSHARSRPDWLSLSK